MKLPLPYAGIDEIVPAAFRRLCVETRSALSVWYFSDPAAFRRLCVETGWLELRGFTRITSRLQAAVC